MKFYSRDDGYSTPSFFCDRQIAPIAPMGSNEVKPTEVMKVIMDLTATYQKIPLIKMLRSFTNLGLKEAKDEIESIPTKYPHPYTSNDIIPMVKIFVKWVPELKAATQAFPSLKDAFLSLEEQAKLAKAQAAAERAKALEQAKRKEKEIKDATARKRKTVLDGVVCAYDNARILGYENEGDAMRDVIARLENNAVLP